MLAHVPPKQNAETPLRSQRAVKTGKRRGTLPCILQGSDSQSGVRDRHAASASPGALLQMETSGATPELLNATRWGRGWATCVLTSPPGTSDAHFSLKTLCFQAAWPGLGDPNWPWSS